MKNISCWVLTTILYCCAVSGAQAAQEPLRINVTAAYENGKPELQISLTNVSNNAIGMRQADLPWGSRDSLYISAFARKRWNALNPVFPEQYPQSVNLTIQPGETLKGSIDLTYYLTMINKYLKNDDVIVFWFYSPKTIDEKTLGEYGDWLVFPRAPTR